MIVRALPAAGIGSLLWLAFWPGGDGNPVAMLLAGFFFAALVWVPAAMRIAVAETNRRHELELRRLERRMRETRR